MNNNVLFGPFFGDFKTETLTFLPYIRWIIDSLNLKSNIYVSSHFNRRFLYNDITLNFIPIYKHLTRNELDQKNYIHKEISIKDFQNFNKYLKNQIKSVFKESINEQYNLPYIKYPAPVSVYQKVFQKIMTDYIPPFKDYVLFIPDKIMNIGLAKKMYEYLDQNYNVVVVGDLRTHFLDKNILVQQPDYIDIVYKYIIGYMTNAKVIICPCSHWTSLANMNKLSVFSWGSQIGSYKKNGIYHFDNEQSMIIPFTKSTDKQILFKQIDYFISKNK